MGEQEPLEVNDQRWREVRARRNPSMTAPLMGEASAARVAEWAASRELDDFLTLLLGGAA